MGGTYWLRRNHHQAGAHLVQNGISDKWVAPIGSSGRPGLANGFGVCARPLNVSGEGPRQKSPSESIGETRGVLAQQVLLVG